MLSQNLQAGATLLDRYEVIERIGEGGFGIVYKARQTSTGQMVAIKVLLSDRLMDEDALAEEIGRFQREMQLISMFSHPNVVKLIDSGVSEGKRFMVLEYIEGRELNDFIKKNGPMAPLIAKRVLSQVLDALAQAHAKGIIHRDLKPQNIMLTGPDSRPNVKILDFGIAGIAETHRQDDYKTLTQAGQIRGTPSYMAPEQIRFGTTSPQSDIYAMGLILLECLTGRRAVTGDSLQDICIKQVLEPLMMPEEILYSPFGPVLERACAKEPAERYGAANPGGEARSAAEEMIADLEAMDLTGMARLDTGELTNSGNIKTGAFGNSIASRSIAARPPSMSVQQQQTTKSGPLKQQDAISEVSASQMAMPAVEQRQSSKTPLIIALVVVTLAGVGGAAYFATRDNSGGAQQPPPAAAPTEQAQNKPTADPAPQNDPNNKPATDPTAQNNPNNKPATDPTAQNNPNNKPATDPATQNPPPKDPTPSTPALYSARSRRVSLNALESLVGGIAQGSRKSSPAVFSFWHVNANVSAKVFSGDKVLCDATPCQILMSRPSEALTVELRADEHKNAELTLEPAGGSVMIATLTKAPAPKKQPPKDPKPKDPKDGKDPKDPKDPADEKRINSFDDED